MKPYQIVLSQGHLLAYIKVGSLNAVAKGLAKHWDTPQKAMLKAMARYTRIYRRK